MIAESVIEIDDVRLTLRRAARAIDRGREGRRGGSNDVRRRGITPEECPGEVAG